MKNITSSSHCTIDLAALKRNFIRFGEASKLMPVIKSDAYGHGLIPVAQALTEVGAQCFAVGTVSEGVALRKNGFMQDILPLIKILHQEDFQQAARYNLLVMLEGFDDLHNASQLSDTGLILRVAIKCETGMNRLGFDAKDIPQLLEFLRSHPTLQPVLALSHLACADIPSLEDYTQRQVKHFSVMCQTLRAAFPDLKRSLNNSAGTIALPSCSYEVCRVGLSLYGGSPFTVFTKNSTLSNLEWCMSVSAPILRIRQIKGGQSISYGGDFTAPHDLTVAVVAAGYATGVDRGLSNRMDLLVNGVRAPQIGRICMGMLMVDVSHVPGIKAGDLAWIIGGNPRAGQKAVTVQEMADTLGTIPYEIMCRMGAANPRFYV